MSSQMHVYQSIARASYEHGVDTMFGLMGDANLFLVDSFVRDCGGRFVPAAHEGSSVLMAIWKGRCCDGHPWACIDQLHDGPHRKRAGAYSFGSLGG